MRSFEGEFTSTTYSHGDCHEAKSMLSTHTLINRSNQDWIRQCSGLRGQDAWKKFRISRNVFHLDHRQRQLRLKLGSKVNAVLRCNGLKLQWRNGSGFWLTGIRIGIEIRIGR